MMARTKYTFEKRQKEIAKLQKKKEKLVRRSELKESAIPTEPGAEQQDAVTPDLEPES
jgi:hypothetical protein